MAKSKNTTNENSEDIVLDSIADAQSQEVLATTPFTEDQMAIVQKMILEAQSGSKKDGSVSVYGKRDPREITQVKVSMFDGKFVLGFKNLQNNPYETRPKYNQLKANLDRRLPSEPFVTLLLSLDGKEIEEREVALIDFMNFRTRVELPVLKIYKKEVIKDHGILGHPGGEFAQGIQESGEALSKKAIKAESKELIMKFYVQLPGFEKPVEFIEDFLA